MRLYLFPLCLVFCVFLIVVPAKPTGKEDGKGQEDQKGCSKKLSKKAEKFLATLPTEDREAYKTLLEEKCYLAKAIKAEIEKENKGKKIPKGKNKKSIPGGPKNPLLNDEDDLFYQGDIMLTIEQMEELMQNHGVHNKTTENGSRVKRKITTDANLKWPNPKQIPYSIVLSTFSYPWYVDTIRETFAYLQQETCLRFVDSTSVGHYLRIIGDQGGCWSNFGYCTATSCAGGSAFQDLSIGTNCNSLITVFHEIGHALGLVHEHARADRDKYLTVDLSSITDSSQAHNFNKMDSMDYGGGYDFSSAMHYSATDYGGSNTVLFSVDPRYQDSMKAGEISFIDLMQINSHYCADECTGSSTACSNGGYPDPNSCGKCKCPQGFGGTLCDQVQQSNPSTCGGTLTATTSWQDLTASQSSRGTHCHWHINSPTDSKIQLNVVELTAYCMNGCYFDYVEVKTGEDPGEKTQTKMDFQRGGYRFCCIAMANKGEFSSFGNKAVVTMKNNVPSEISFKLQYKYTDGSAPPTPPPPSPPSGGCVDTDQYQCAHEGSPECTSTSGYAGTKATTLDGITCSLWSVSQSFNPTDAQTNDHNYCRNPDNDKAPWCLTSIGWGYCFPKCSSCVNTTNQCANAGSAECTSTSAYFGTKSTTKTGNTCMFWSIHSHYNPSDAQTIDHNYCRNPDGNEAPWCFISSTHYDYCFNTC